MDEYNDYFIRETSRERPIGYPPSGIIRKALENLYISIVGALDVGDFETFLKEVADLTYDEAKEKMIMMFGTPKELSAAKLKAESAEAAAKLEEAEREALEEQRTLGQEFEELEEVARKRLAENLELFRRNEALEAEVRRLKEELERVKAVPPPVAPPGVPAPPAPPAVVPPTHGSMYSEYRRLVSEVLTIDEINQLASEIFDIAEKEEFDKLTKSDIDELLSDLRKIGERRAIKLAEIRLPKEKPAIRRVPERVEAPPFIGVLPPQVMYRYMRGDMEEMAFAGERFVVDHELVRTILRNNLLLFPTQWYYLPQSEKIKRYGWDIASAFKHAVEFLHKFSWDELEKDYGIPRKYIDAWRAAS